MTVAEAATTVPGRLARRSLVLVGALLLALVGCGSNEPSSAPTTVQSTVVQTTTTTFAAPERCNNVGFDPSTDNVAADILAQGLTCAEAEAFVRTNGRPLGPINGSERLDADGYTCIRTAQDESGLPAATYVCTNGAKRITFVRT